MPSQTVALRPEEPAAAADKTPPTPEARPAVNTIELVSAAQTEMKRLGCFTGKTDGKINARTSEALKRYLKERELSSDDANVTDALLKDMKEQGERVCPLECDRDEVAKGGRCVAAPRPSKKSAPVARREEPARPVARQRREPDRPARVAAQPPRQPAAPPPSSRPSAKMLGVGF